MTYKTLRDIACIQTVSITKKNSFEKGYIFTTRQPPENCARQPFRNDRAECQTTKQGPDGKHPMSH